MCVASLKHGTTATHWHFQSIVFLKNVARSRSIHAVGMQVGFDDGAVGC
jgi:hypothetical protein